MDAPVAILGATGFIGRRLAECLAAEGVPVTGISRSPNAHVAGVSRWMKPEALDLSGHKAVINLAGERVDRRWTTAAKQVLEDSRIGVTRRLVEHLAGLESEVRPEILINGSGIGVYGNTGDAAIDESAPPGDDYLAQLCVKWEAEAEKAAALGIRVVLLRTGIVLGRGGAAFDKLHRLFRLGLGGRLGSGLQWMPWIHLEDQVAGMLHALRTPSISGPVNFNAPVPERNRDFTRKFAHALHRPALLPVPGFALKLALGGFGAAMLGGQRATPAALQHQGFEFRYPTLEEALEDLVQHR
jgi:uncharacterized protein (TIGR01777 family)